MCGICGAAALSPAAHLPGPEAVSQMTSLLSHRGPDDQGSLHEPGVALGHRRLSIIDRAGGHQPIANEDGSRFVIFNGEIYNHREIRARLEGMGHVYRTASDTESILHLVEQDGVDGLNRMNGMWAFAVWDRGRRELLLARDRLGIKPLYYAQVGQVLLFASEIKALLASDLIPRDLDPSALAACLECQYVPGPRTIFKAIKKLPPGHALVAGPAGIRSVRYWNPAFVLSPLPTLAEAAARLRDLLADAVRLRLLAEVPLGAFLSGGMDSSIVVGLMSRVSERPVKTFTVGFEGEGWFDESAEGERVARHFGTDHHTLHVGSLDLPAFLEKAVWALDEPMADPASIPTYLISRFAREEVTVALTGEGGDELFGGYDHYRFERWLESLGAFGVAAGIAGAALPAGWFPAKVRKAVEAAALREPDRHLRVRGTIAPDKVRDLLRSRADGSAPRATREALDQATARYPSSDGINRLLFQDAVTWLPDDLLMKVDRMSMLASLEARVPFLDYRVVEFAFSLPGSYKLHGNRSKIVLREAFRDLVPAETLRRRKHGFAVPVGRWLRHDLRTYARDIFASRDDAFYDYLDRQVVEQVLRQFYDRGVDCSLPVWTLLGLKVWFRSVFRAASCRAEPRR